MVFIKQSIFWPRLFIFGKKNLHKILLNVKKKCKLIFFHKNKNFLLEFHRNSFIFFSNNKKVCFLFYPKIKNSFSSHFRLKTKFLIIHSKWAHFCSSLCQWQSFAFFTFSLDSNCERVKCYTITKVKAVILRDV